MSIKTTTTRGQVFAQFQKWAGKGINPQNECRLEIVKCRRFPRQYQIWMGQAIAWAWNSRQERPDEIWSTAARILLLGLEKPKAKAIEWESKSPQFFRSIDYYTIEFDGRKYYPAYCGRDLAPGCDTLEEAQSICQAHKQVAYDKMGGWE